MSFTEHEMYNAAYHALRRRYPAMEGWKIYAQDDWGEYRPDFVVERRHKGKIERVVVEVKADCVIAKKYINQLNRYVRNLSGSNVKIVNKILIVPAGTDTSVVPNEIEIIYLRTFLCE